MFSYILTLFLLCQDQVSSAGELVFFNRPILDKPDAKEFRDSNATIARAVIQEKIGFYYVKLEEYLLSDFIQHVGSKKLNLVLESNPQTQSGWSGFYQHFRGMDGDRFYLQFNSVRGPGRGRGKLVEFNETEHPDSLKVIIFGFAEEENELYKYKSDMLLSMYKLFKGKPKKVQRWLRLNAYHLKNMEKGQRIRREDFDHFDNFLIIYRNDNRTQGSNAVFQEDVLERLQGFDPYKIIWENVEVRGRGGETTTENSKATRFEPTIMFLLLSFVLLFLPVNSFLAK